MREHEVEALIESGVIKQVVLYATPEKYWEVWVYGDLQPGTGNRVTLARGGARTWVSLDTAHSWIKKRLNGKSIELKIDV